MIGEEAAAADPAIHGLWAEDAPVWVIDPVDGTWNFSEGRGISGQWSPSCRAEAIEAAWINDPLGSDRLEREAAGGSPPRGFFILWTSAGWAEPGADGHPVTKPGTHGLMPRAHRGRAPFPT